MSLSHESTPQEILAAMQADRRAREARTAARTLTNSAKASKIRFFTDPEVLAERVYAKCPELKARRDAAVKEASELKSKIASTVAKTNELRRAIAATPKAKAKAPAPITARELLAMSEADRKLINGKCMFGTSGKPIRLQIKAAFASASQAEKSALLKQYRGAIVNFPSES